MRFRMALVQWRSWGFRHFSLSVCLSICLPILHSASLIPSGCFPFNASGSWQDVLCGLCGAWASMAALHKVLCYKPQRSFRSMSQTTVNQPGLLPPFDENRHTNTSANRAYVLQQYTCVAPGKTNTYVLRGNGSPCRKPLCF